MGMDRWGETVNGTMEHLSPPSVRRANRGGWEKRPQRPLQTWNIDEVGEMEALHRLFPSSHLNTHTHILNHTHYTQTIFLARTKFLRDSAHLHCSSSPPLSNIHVHLNPGSILTYTQFHTQTYTHTLFLKPSPCLHYWNPLSTLAFYWHLTHHTSDP